MAGLSSRFGFGAGHVVDVNGAPGLFVTVDGSEQLIAIDVRVGLIHSVYAVLNPDKLGRIRP